MDSKRILDSFNVLDKNGDLEKFHHLLENKYERYETTITRNVGTFLYPKWIKEKVPAIIDNSIYLINEDEYHKLIYDKGIRMFKLTVKNGLLVSESISLSTEFTKNKEDLLKIIELLIHKLNEPNRNYSSSL